MGEIPKCDFPASSLPLQPWSPLPPPKKSHSWGSGRNQSSRRYNIGDSSLFDADWAQIMNYKLLLKEVFCMSWTLARKERFEIGTFAHVRHLAWAEYFHLQLIQKYPSSKALYLHSTSRPKSSFGFNGIVSSRVWWRFQREIQHIELTRITSYCKQ